MPPTATTSDRLINPNEAAKILGTTPGTLSVWRCSRRYDLPYVKVGKSVRYRLSAVWAFVDSRTVGGEVDPE